MHEAVAKMQRAEAVKGMYGLGVPGVGGQVSSSSARIVY